MSTKSTIFYHASEDYEVKDPKIHVYSEMLDDPPHDIRMEIDTGYCVLDIPLPEDFQKWVGIRRQDAD